MINLFEDYNQTSWDLHYSLIVSGYNNPTIVINDNGFLPEDVTSPYLFFTGFVKENGRPLYFNEVEVPEFWEIAGTNSGGEVVDFEHKRAHIHYAEPKHQRFVQSVDWYDEVGRIRLIDRYNKFGYRYAQTNVNLDGRNTFTSYFNKFNQEIITENHTTGDVILNYQNQVYMFKNKAEFVTFYLKAVGYDLDRIFYNSLATPFLVAYRLNEPGRDVLFWQENIGEVIPGNMAILHEDRTRQTKVVVQHHAAFEKMQPLLTPAQAASTEFLGFLYPFKRQNNQGKEVLILTNSDQLEGIEEIVSQQSDYRFHIGALTEMSSKLMDLGNHSNVSLYPNISQQQVNHVFKSCDLYLDINRGNEILSAIRSAFENNMLILAFENTKHSDVYIAKENTISKGDVSAMNQLLINLSLNPSLRETLLKHQLNQSKVENDAHYRTVIR